MARIRVELVLQLVELFAVLFQRSQGFVLLPTEGAICVIVREVYPLARLDDESGDETFAGEDLRHVSTPGASGARAARRCLRNPYFVGLVLGRPAAGTCCVMQ